MSLQATFGCSLVCCLAVCSSRGEHGRCGRRTTIPPARSTGSRRCIPPPCCSACWSWAIRISMRGTARSWLVTVASLQRSTLNARDAALQHKGYYEKLDNASRMSAQLWNIQAQQPAHWVG